MTDQAWETSKENIAPLVKGRNTKSLQKAFSMSADKLEREKQTFEASLRDALAGKGTHKNDPLAVWASYVKWVLTNYPAGSKLLIRIVEDACRMYAKEERYRDDRRLLRLWITYVELRQDKLDVFNYMHRKNIGVSHTLLYEAWAITLELARQYDRAEEIYRLGKQRNAKPSDRLLQREREYYNRMAARARRDVKKRKEAAEKNADKVVREALRRERDGLSPSPSLNSTVTEPQHALPSSRAPKMRPALGKLTEGDAQSSHRPLVREPSERSSAFKMPQGNRLGSSENNPKQPIEVYRDSHSPALFEASDSNGPSSPDPFPALAKAHVVDKENTGRLPEKWAGQTILQNDSLVRKMKMSRMAHKSTAPFEVYQESDADQYRSDPIVHEVFQGSKQEDENSSSDLSVRERPDDCQPQSPIPSLMARSDIGNSSPTINTKLAERAVLEQFNTSLPMEVQRQNVIETVDNSPLVASQRNGARIQIYQDAEDDVENSGHNNPRNEKVGSDIPSTVLGEHILQNRPMSPVPTIRSKPEFQPVSPTIGTVLAEQAIIDQFNTCLPVEQNRQAQVKKRSPINVLGERVLKSRSISPVPGSVHKPSLQPESPRNGTVLADRSIHGQFNASLSERRGREVLVENGAPTNASILYQTPTTRRNPHEFEVYRDADVDKENAGGHVRQDISGPSGHPALERRVLKPLPELEGPYIPREDTIESHSGTEHCTAEQKDPENIGQALSAMKSNDTFDLAAFLGSWCFRQPTFQLLDEPDPEVEADGMFDLPWNDGAPASFNVDMYHWKGFRNHSNVVLAEDLNNSFGLMDMDEEIDSADDDLAIVAVKVSQASNAWEYYMYKTVEARLSKPLFSVARAVAFYEGRPKSYLILDSTCTCSLAEVLQIVPGRVMPESLCMVFMVDLLRTLEFLHGVSIIHSDVTLDNVLFRNDTSRPISLDEYSASGEGGWSGRGVLLVDFNHSIDALHSRVQGTDLEALTIHAGSLGNEFLLKDYRVPGADKWGYNADCYGAAICAAKMLGVGSFNLNSAPGNIKHMDVWEKLFDSMRGLGALSAPDDTMKAMRECRVQMESILEKDIMMCIIMTRLSNMVVAGGDDDLTQGAY